MPAIACPADSDMPRVQSPSHGASERLVVSPGRESEGIFHMPAARALTIVPVLPCRSRGVGARRATPFLPGATKHGCF
jgi:penicillin amidase